MPTNIPIIDPKVIARESAKILFETNSILFNAKEPFTYTSGRVGPVYIDCRRLISFPRARAALMDFGASLLIQNAGYEAFDVVAGGETAGIPYAAFMAERLDLPMVYVRKKPKGFGRMAQIEGALEQDNPRVLLVEDLQTDGGSKKIFVDALREAGATVEHAFVVFHYGIFEASTKNMESLGINLHALTTWHDALATADDNEYFDSETLKQVSAFLDDPIQWSADNGGATDETAKIKA